MTAWTEHIKDFAKRNNMTYGCALSDPKCSAEYKEKRPPKLNKKEQKENEQMGAEEKTGEHHRKVVAHKGRVMKLKERLGEVMENSAMEKEDHPAPAPAPQEAPKKKRGRPKKTEEHIKMTIKEKGKVGRPKKYATEEEAKKAKTEKSIESNKRRAKEKAETAQMGKEDKPAEEGSGLVKPATLKKLVAKLRAEIKHHKGEGRPVDYLEECIKMLQGRMRGGADIQQKGLSAQIRTYLPAGNEDLYRELSFIVHSGDRNPHAHGHNSYADPTNTYDASAESAVLYAENLVKGKTHLKKGVAVPRKRGATPPSPSAKKARADSPLRVSPEVGAKYASASAKALSSKAEPFVPKEFGAKGLATMPSGSKIYPLSLGQVARLARGII